MSMLDLEVAMEIGETIGNVIPSEHTKEMVGRDFLRVRVEIDVSKPLCRGRKIAINANEFIWVAFKYEKLPNFCYWCGRVSHADKECSYAWRSILKGQDVLMKGARWRVGSGESIGIWNDAWLPSLEYPRVLSNPVTSFEDMKVNDLIDPVSKQWDAGLLQGLFSSQEVELIMSIPLCRTYIEDKLIWPYTSLGNYTMKSGLSVPNKVKNFLWRVCKEALPVKRNLRQRKIIEEDTCDHCKSSAESEVHTRWECSALTSVWNSVPELPLHHDQNVHTVSELNKLTRDEGKDVNLLAMILWTVWYRWKKLRTTNEEFPVSQVSTNAKQALTEYHQANQIITLQSPVCTHPRVK
ncbi:hypothetical protein SO802_008505 [Lithocarpus litseifolius]|uniref:CCHC-type domain-containing protein n=1 Tax=Lithocarpus litseifolius TaxID=425828 RepID=A0AAW2DBE4_9ROSI